MNTLVNRFHALFRFFKNEVLLWAFIMPMYHFVAVYPNYVWLVFGSLAMLALNLGNLKSRHLQPWFFKTWLKYGQPGLLLLTSLVFFVDAYLATELFATLVCALFAAIAAGTAVHSWQFFRMHAESIDYAILLYEGKMDKVMNLIQDPVSVMNSILLREGKRDEVTQNELDEQ